MQATHKKRWRLRESSSWLWERRGERSELRSFHSPPGRTRCDTDTRDGNGSKLPEGIQRWTAKRRAALVMSTLRGETTVVEAARKHDLTVADIEHWKDAFLLGAENALRSRPKDEEALQQEQIKKLERKVGQLVMALDIAREAMKLRPFPEPTSDE